MYIKNLEMKKERSRGFNSFLVLALCGFQLWSIAGSHPEQAPKKNQTPYPNPTPQERGVRRDRVRIEDYTLHYVYMHTCVRNCLPLERFDSLESILDIHPTVPLRTRRQRHLRHAHQYATFDVLRMPQNEWRKVRNGTIGRKGR